MADKDLQVINSSGDITGVNLNGTASGDAILTSDEISAVITATYGTSAFSDAVGEETQVTGILTHDDTVSINTDTTKIDIIAFDFYLKWVKYHYVGATGLTPTVGTGDSSTWVGIDSSGLVYSEEKFTEAQTETILPLARLQAVQGESGPGSHFQSPIPLEFPIDERGYHDRVWHDGCIGVLYQSGGLYTENTTAALQVDQAVGKFHNAQRKHLNITADVNIEVSALYSVSGVPTLQTRATLVVPKFYDDGTDIVALSTDKYVSHTLLRSPKEEDLFFLVYGDTEYDSQSQAEDAKPDYSIFQGQSISGLYTVARFIVKGDSTNIEAIQDERPKIILPDESTGTGVLPPSYAGTYISSSAETTITTQDVFVKVAGTTAAVASSADFTVSTSNRFTYTGATTRRFKSDLVSSLTSASVNKIAKLRLAINGTTIAASEQSKLGDGNTIGTVPLTYLPELSQGDYIELWIANGSDATNLTVDNMNMNIITVD